MRSMFALFIAALMASPVQAAAPVAGKWLTTEKDSIIEISPCGPALCGKIFRILQPTDDGKPATDRYNPNVALRSRPVLGLTILHSFVDNGANWKGQIYDPRNGKTYKSFLQRLPDGNLKLKGCVGPFCRSLVYTPSR